MEAADAGGLPGQASAPTSPARVKTASSLKPLPDAEKKRFSFSPQNKLFYLSQNATLAASNFLLLIFLGIMQTEPSAKRKESNCQWHCGGAFQWHGRCVVLCTYSDLWGRLGPSGTDRGQRINGTPKRRARARDGNRKRWQIE